MKEYELLNRYLYNNAACRVFKVVSLAIENNVPYTINVDKCREEINEVFDFIKVKNRFDALYDNSKAKLSCNFDCFELAGHKFENLDDVEKALQMKAFL